MLKKKQTTQSKVLGLLVFSLFLGLFFVGTISAFEFDNVKNYDEETKTVDIRNSILGIPFLQLGKIAEVKLDTPTVNNVTRGKNRLVAEFTIESFKDYTEGVFDDLDFYNIKKDMEQFEREFVYRYKEFYDVEIIDYETICKERLSINGTLEKYDCTDKQIGTHLEERFNWIELNKELDLLKGVITIGIFTDVLPNERVEWIPTLFGVEINEWATWTESLNVDLISYYKFDDNLANTNVDDELDANEGTLGGGDNTDDLSVAGKISTALDFNGIDDNVDIGTMGSFGSSLELGYSISFWVKTTETAFTSPIGVFEATSGNPGFVIDFNYGTGVDIGKFRVFMRDKDNNALAAHTTNDENFRDGAWHHIVATVKGTTNTVVLYLDGSSVGVTHSVTNTPDNFDNFTKPIILGAKYLVTSVAGFVDGTFDEFVIWDKILSSDEVGELWNNGDGITYSAGDSTFPYFIDGTPTNQTITYGEALTYNINATDETALDCFVVNDSTNFVINCSGYLENNTLLSYGLYNLNVTINDSSNNMNSSFFWVNVTKGNPATNMVISGITPIEYGTTSDFSESETNAGDGGCSYSMDLSNEAYGVGTWTFNYSTAGCTNYTAGSVIKDLVVDQNSSLLLGISGTTPLTYGTITDVAGSDCPAQLSCALDIGDAVYGVEVSPLTFNYSTAGNTNYTASSITKDITINQAIPVGSLTSNLGWTINESQEVVIGLSQTNGGDGDVTYIVYRDNVSKSTGETWSPSLGTYNYILNTSGGTNYTANTSMDAETLTVNDIITPSITINYPTAVTYSKNVSNLNYTVVEINPGFCWYSVNGGVTNSSTLSMGLNFTDVVSVGGSNTWDVYCNDTSNNINSDSVTFSLNKLWYNDGYPFANNSFRTTDFITVSGKNFTLGDEQYRFLGADSYYLADYGTNHTYDDDGNEINGSRSAVLEILNEAQYLNINVLRTWAGMQGSDDSHWIINESGGHHNLFEIGTPGNYSEEMFASLDWVLYEASKRNIRLQLVLINNWNDYGGMRWYVQKSPTTDKTYEDVDEDEDPNYYWSEFKDQFYTDENTRQYFRNYINYTLNRNNTYSGVLYKDDPAIFSWLLANEPRAKSDGEGRTMISNWTTNMTAYIKSIDSNHLVGLGIEGWGYVETWGEGTDMIADHNNTGVDFATFALHPDQWKYFAERSEHTGEGQNWVTDSINTNAYIDWWVNDSGISYNNRYEASYVPSYTPALARGDYENWVVQNVRWANEMDMPILLQEAGYLTNHSHEIKDRFYEQMIHNFYNEGGDGLMFWTLNHDDYYYSTNVDGDMDDGYGFYLSDDAFLRNKSQSVIDAINFTRYDNDGGSWINQMNSYKYDFVLSIGFASDTIMSNCTLNLNISNGTSWTNFYVDQLNLTSIFSDDEYTFIKQFDDYDEEFYWYTECYGGGTYINSSSTHVQVKTGTPVITLTFPADEGLYGNIDMNFTYVVTEDGGPSISNCELYIDTTLNKTDYTVSKGVSQLFLVNLPSLSDTYEWYVKCTDIDDNVGLSTTRNFTIDANYPQIIIIFPPMNTNTTNADIEINYTVSDTNIDSCWYSNDTYSYNYTLANCVNVTGVTWSEGQHNITIWSNDSVNNLNSSSVTFNVDTIQPSIVIIYPANNSNHSLNTIEVNYTVSDVNLDSCWYSNDTYSYNYTLANCVNITGVTWSDGQHSVIVWANDSFNNLNLSSITFNIDSSSPYFIDGTPQNQTIIYDVALGYDINATDVIGFDCFAVNDSKFKINCSGYLENNTHLGVALYNLNITINDTYNNVNSTIMFVDIVQAGDTFDVLLNGVLDNLTVAFPQQVNVSVSNNLTPLSIDVNGTTFTNANNYTLGGGVWFVNISTEGNQNYTANESHWYITINKATPTGTLAGTSPITYGTAGNVEGTETNTDDADLVYKLLRDLTVVSNPDNDVLGVGTYNYIYNVSGGQNYSSVASLDTFVLTVDIDAGDGTLLLNGSATNYTINRTANVNITAVLDTGSGDISVYIDTTLFQTGSSPISDEEQFNIVGWYLINFTYPGNENYTGFEKYLYVNVTANPLAVVNIVYPTVGTEYEEHFVALNYTVLYATNCWYDLGEGGGYVGITCGDNVTGITSIEGANIWIVKVENMDGINTTDSVSFTVDLPIEFSKTTLGIVEVLKILIMFAGLFIIAMTGKSFFEGEVTFGRLFTIGAVVGLAVAGLFVLAPILINYISDLIH